MRKFDVSERRHKISELVQESGFFRSSELSRLLGVSEMTIRRDIEKLSSIGIIESVHGGAKAVYPRSVDYSFNMRLGKNRSAKQSVAQRALSFLVPNSIIGLDAGTTVLEFARILPSDINITVVTYSLPVMTQLSNKDNIELIGLGGMLRSNTQAFVGPLAHLAINQLRLDTLFLGTKAIQGNALYSGNPYDAEIKRALINAAEKVILLVDTTKFQATAGIRVAGLEEIDTLIVDCSFDGSSIMVPESVDLIMASNADEDF